MPVGHADSDNQTQNPPFVRWLPLRSCSPPPLFTRFPVVAWPISAKLPFPVSPRQMLVWLNLFLYFPLVSRPTFHVLCANRFLRVYSVAITAAHLNLIHKALPPLRLRNLTRILCSRLFPQEIGKETPWTKPVDYAAEWKNLERLQLWGKIGTLGPFTEKGGRVENQTSGELTAVIRLFRHSQGWTGAAIGREDGI